MIDVIVVGAGPAGNSAAWRLASLGHEVVVLESRDRIGDKLCTGIVGVNGLERLSPVSPETLREISSATLTLPSDSTVRVDMGRPYARVIDRVDFVASIARKAQEAGACYPGGGRVTGVAVGPEEAMVRTSVDLPMVDGTGGVLRARAVVLASGFGSRFTKSLGLGSVGDYVLGAQAEVITDGLEETRIFLGRSYAPGFFAWLVPTHRNRALAGLLARRNPMGHLKSLIDDLQTRRTVREVVGRPGKWGIPLKPLARSYGERVLVVGDAAGQVKPTTGGGIYYSLLCADIAARTLHDALEADDLSARRLGEYEKRWKDMLGRELRVGWYARRLYGALGDAQVEHLANLVTQNGVYREIVQDRVSSFDWHSDLILKGIKHQAVSSIINPLRFLMP